MAEAFCSHGRGVTFCPICSGVSDDPRVQQIVERQATQERQLKALVDVGEIVEWFRLRQRWSYAQAIVSLGRAFDTASSDIAFLLEDRKRLIGEGERLMKQQTGTCPLCKGRRYGTSDYDWCQCDSLKRAEAAESEVASLKAQIAAVNEVVRVWQGDERRRRLNYVSLVIAQTLALASQERAALGAGEGERT